MSDSTYETPTLDVVAQDPNLYRQLDVVKNAGDGEIKQAFRRASQKYHPDHGGSEKTFKLLNNAKDVLRNSEKKAEFDKSLPGLEKQWEEEKKRLTEIAESRAEEARREVRKKKREKDAVDYGRTWGKRVGETFFDPESMKKIALTLRPLSKYFGEDRLLGKIDRVGSDWAGVDDNEIGRTLIIERADGGVLNRDEVDEVRDALRRVEAARRYATKGEICEDDYPTKGIFGTRKFYDKGFKEAWDKVKVECEKTPHKEFWSV